MKTLLVLTLLVALVGLGVWNSPNGEPSVLFYQAEISADHDTVFQLGIDADGKPEIRGESGDVIPWAEYTAGRVKNADEIAKVQAEWAGDEYGNVFLPGAQMRDMSTPRNITPASDVEYRAPMQDGWFARMDALLAERDAK